MADDKVNAPAPSAEGAGAPNPQNMNNAPEPAKRQAPPENAKQSAPQKGARASLVQAPGVVQTPDELPPTAPPEKAPDELPEATRREMEAGKAALEGRSVRRDAVTGETPRE